MNPRKQAYNIFLHFLNLQFFFPFVKSILMFESTSFEGSKGEEGGSLKCKH